MMLWFRCSCFDAQSLRPRLDVDSFLFHRTIIGVATLGSLKSKVLKCKVSLHDPVRNATYNTFHKVTLDTTLEKLDRILDKEHFALVVHSQRLCKKTSNFVVLPKHFKGTFINAIVP